MDTRVQQALPRIAILSALVIASGSTIAAPPPPAALGVVWSSTSKGAFAEPSGKVPAASYTISVPGSFFPKPVTAVPAARTLPYLAPNMPATDAATIAPAQYRSIQLFNTDTFPRPLPLPPPAVIGPTDRFPEP